MQGFDFYFYGNEKYKYRNLKLKKFNEVLGLLDQYWVVFVGMIVYMGWRCILVG